MELQDVKGIDAILEQAGIYSTVSEQLADHYPLFLCIVLNVNRLYIINNIFI